MTGISTDRQALVTVVMVVVNLCMMLGVQLLCIQWHRWLKRKQRELDDAIGSVTQMKESLMSGRGT